jgi:hypothetical protein
MGEQAGLIKILSTHSLQAQACVREMLGIPFRVYDTLTAMVGFDARKNQYFTRRHDHERSAKTGLCYYSSINHLNGVVECHGAAG